MKEEKRGRRSKRANKKIRVNSSFSKDTHEKLDRLAMVCGVTKTSLAAHLVELCLNNENIINFVQDQYQETARLRVIPTKVGGKLEFIFTEKHSSTN